MFRFESGSSRALAVVILKDPIRSCLSAIGKKQSYFSNEESSDRVPDRFSYYFRGTIIFIMDWTR